MRQEEAMANSEDNRLQDEAPIAFPPLRSGPLARRASDAAIRNSGDPHPTVVCT